jgi:hypothetical protein
MFDRAHDVQPTSATDAPSERRPNERRQPFVPPAVTELGRMNDLTLLGGSL